MNLLESSKHVTNSTLKFTDLSRKKSSEIGLRNLRWLVPGYSNTRNQKVFTSIYLNESRNEEYSLTNLHRLCLKTYIDIYEV